VWLCLASSSLAIRIIFTASIKKSLQAKLRRIMSLGYEQQKKALSFGLGLCLILGGTIAADRSFTTSVLAQTLNPEEVASVVYQKLPNLPLENQYLDRETQATATNHTLISRLIRYHQYIKSRPTKYRIDWQLTLADYFGINETIQKDRYPGSSTLTVNPLEGDRQIITKLTRQQRLDLIDILVEIYSK
jgi:hypothetical protein